MSIPVIAIFDVGKTNKKLFLFNSQYEIVYEKTARLIETVDEDGDPCENIESLKLSIFEALNEVFKLQEFSIRAINFSTYGASFVYIDANGDPLTPLYNYLKVYPKELQHEFYSTHGGEAEFTNLTASPVLGSLNSGMQLYRLKYERPHVFCQVKYALHLPQYVSYLLTGVACSDITSIGCHTNLWNFHENKYHYWVSREGIAEKLAPILPGNKVMPISIGEHKLDAGIGLHDSSAALIPYLVNFQEPFILVSTGTWCISLNPFNEQPLTPAELQNDCLCYMSFEGKPVKAARLFAGYEHEQQLKRIADHYNESPGRYRDMHFDAAVVQTLRQKFPSPATPVDLKASRFPRRPLTDFQDGKEAYHQLIIDILEQQVFSTSLILDGTSATRIFVDGGFSTNTIYMNLLAAAFPHMEVYAATMAQATALGTALAIHNSWNNTPLPTDLIELKFYSGTQAM